LPWGGTLLYYLINHMKVIVYEDIPQCFSVQTQEN